MSVCNSMLYAQRLDSTVIAIFLCKSSNILLNGCVGCIPSPDYNNLIQGCDWPRATDGRISMSATTVHNSGASTRPRDSTHPGILQTNGVLHIPGFYRPLGGLLHIPEAL
jgi:hypothetical protein